MILGINKKIAGLMAGSLVIGGLIGGAAGFGIAHEQGGRMSRGGQGGQFMGQNGQNGRMMQRGAYGRGGVGANGEGQNAAPAAGAPAGAANGMNSGAQMPGDQGAGASLEMQAQ